MPYGKHESDILNVLASFSLEEINQGISELEEKNGKIFLGSIFEERLEILNTLKKHAERSLVCREVSNLKQAIFVEWSKRTDLKTARAKTFCVWVKCQNQLKGIEFVRDSLKYELEQLQHTEVTANV